METVTLQGAIELQARENIPQIPQLVQRYLDMKEKQAEGKYFRVVIDEKSNLNTGAGIAYSNALRIEKKCGELWAEVYSTGMMQYRGAYAHEIDNWDLSLRNPTIIEESETEVIYALSTGGGNVKVYLFSEGKLQPVVKFNIRDHEQTKERIELLQNVINDAEAFRSYVSKNLGDRWYTASEIGVWEKECAIFDASGQKLGHSDCDNVEEKGNVVVLLANHWDRGYDAIVDSYRLFVWVKGKGFGSTGTYQTGLRHPGGKFYSVGLGFDVTLTNRERNSLGLSVEACNRSQQWKESRDLRIEWQGEESSDFERKVEEAKAKVVQAHRHNHPLYKPTRITESVIDAERQIAAWILFEQIDTDRGHQDCEGWLGDQFRYSLWVMEADADPQQIHEDHDYIRPSSVSALTGTRGRDCTISNLRIEDGTVYVTGMEGEKVEEQQPKDLAFA